MKNQARHSSSNRVLGYLAIAWLLALIVVMPILSSLRIGGVIDTEWLWILSPLWLPFFVALFFLLCGLVFLAGIYWLGGIVAIRWDEES